MLENPICAVNRMSRCYWLDTGGRLRPNHVKRTDLGREPPFLTKSKGGSKITLAYKNPLHKNTWVIRIYFLVPQGLILQYYTPRYKNTSKYSYF
jgi:hypothetical protein